jgi:ABC-type Fe3+ transport system substrate-binding protein
VVALSARYTATVLRDAAHPDAAIKFVDFLLGPQGRAVMQEHGLDTAKPSVGGNPGKMPAQIRSEIDATK